MASTLDLLKRLHEHGVQFVVVGGLAGVLHGSRMVTEDVDVCAPLTPENIPRIVASLCAVHPTFRMRPDHLALPDDPDKLAGFKNLYLATDLGPIDFLSEITGLGAYAQVSRRCITVDLEGMQCQVLDLDALIQAKRALGRPRDLQAAAELEVIRDRLRKGEET